MRQTFLPFSRPSITDADLDGVAEVLRSGWITTGPKATEFESALSARVGAPSAVALTSATAGMHLVLRALGIGPGDEVVTPAMTWVSTVNLIVLAGATPVFADIDRDTMISTPEHIAACLGGRTKLVVPVHYAGAAADMAAIRRLAADRGIGVIEDAAHAIGTVGAGGEVVGSVGTSIFSFHPIKVITTTEGGMVCSDDAEMIRRLRRLRFHGLEVDAWDRASQGRPPKAEVHEPGFKYNLPDIAASLGLTQLARLDRLIDRRRELAALYDEAFAEVDEILPLRTSETTTRHAWALYVVRLDSDRAGIDRDELIERLKQRNIGAGLHFRAAHEHAWYRAHRDAWRGELPHTEWNSARILSLPLFPDMTDADVSDVVRAIKEALVR